MWLLMQHRLRSKFIFMLLAALVVVVPALALKLEAMMPGKVAMFPPTTTRADKSLVVSEEVVSDKRRHRRRQKASSGVHLATRLFRNIPPASAALVAASVAGGEAFPDSLDPLVGLACLEFAFQLARRAQLALLETSSSSQPVLPELPGNETYAEFWSKIVDATEDVASFLEGWFVGSPRAQDLTRQDVEEMIAKNVFGLVKEDMAQGDLEQLSKMRKTLEDALGFRFRLEGKAGSPRPVPIALAFDSLSARQHPLLMYALLAVVRVRHRRELDKELGFAYRGRTPRDHLAYWVRGDETATEKTPIVFAHGIGVGLLPYARFVESLVKADPDRPVVLLELPAISTALVSAPMAQGAVLAEEVRAALGNRECVFVAHSFGSTLAAYLAKFQPHLLAGLVLVEPVCFLLNLPKVTRRVFYDTEADPLLKMVSSDPNNAFSLRRRFWWQEAILMAETLRSCLKAPSTVFLAQDDKIVPTRDVQTYLRKKRQKREVILPGKKPHLDVQIFENAGHGRWQRSSDSIDRVVQASLDAATALDRRRKPPLTNIISRKNYKPLPAYFTRTRRRLKVRIHGTVTRKLRHF